MEPAKAIHGTLTSLPDPLWVTVCSTQQDAITVLLLIATATQQLQPV